MNRRSSWTRILPSLGRDFPVEMRLFTSPNDDITAPRRDAAKRALENAQKLQPNSPETLLALGYYQYWVLREYEFAKTTFGLVRKMLPGSSEVPRALAIARREETEMRALPTGSKLSPGPAEHRAVEAKRHRGMLMLREFQPALKLYDRALDIRPQ